MRLLIAMLATTAWVAHAEAVSMNEAVRNCYADGRKWCRDLGHGTKMQNCLNLHFK